jgi:hypothetical protein
MRYMHGSQICPGLGVSLARIFKDWAQHGCGFTVDCRRRLHSDRLVRPHLVVEHEVGRDLLRELGGVGDLALWRCSYLRTRECASRADPTTAAALPTRCLPTARYAPAQAGTESRQNLALCSTIRHETAPPVIPYAWFLNLVSLVRFQPGAPEISCTGRFPEASSATTRPELLPDADILPTCAHPPRPGFVHLLRKRAVLKVGRPRCRRPRAPHPPPRFCL